MSCTTAVVVPRQLADKAWGDNKIHNGGRENAAGPGAPLFGQKRGHQLFRGKRYRYGFYK